MTYEEFKAFSYDERRSYINNYRKQGITDRQKALELGLQADQVAIYYRMMERLGVQISKAPDRRKSETLCWECKKACGLCSWSHELKPVEGWVATIENPKVGQSCNRLKHIPDYKVISCPEFENERRPAKRGTKQ